MVDKKLYVFEDRPNLLTKNYWSVGTSQTGQQKMMRVLRQVKLVDKKSSGTKTVEIGREKLLGS